MGKGKWLCIVLGLEGCCLMVRYLWNWVVLCDVKD